MTDPSRLADELLDARGDLLGVLERLPAADRERRDLVGTWGERELLAHLGYWAGHSAEAIHRVALGEADAFDVDAPGVDERNDTVARIARQTLMGTVRAREEAAVDALAEALRALDAALMRTRLPDGGTLEEQVRVDGPDHYREHAEQLRAG